jgi:selenocysteine-specific elongation factor
MRSLIIGTAGHIDHGKTSLVKALTGIDADRLEEEKRRGITIDLGFAHMQLAGVNAQPLQLGFVDVPGHERFVRNMLAGVGGMDLVLLVIAADESIQPQTREHLDILSLLGVPRGITVLTKSDAVDSETIGVVRMEVEELLRGTFLESPASPIVSVSARTGHGIEKLKQEIARIGAQTVQRDSSALIRLPIDRVFTMKGFGTVITGTLLGGTVRIEDELEVHPGGTPVRVRGVQVHGEKERAAHAGQRTALNVTGTSKGNLTRGMMLAPIGLLSPTTRVDALLTLLPDSKPLKRRNRMHFHAHTFEALAEVIPLEVDGIHLAEATHGKGQKKILARIKLPEATLLVPGDRFILRQSSPTVTIGGGVILDAFPAAKKPRDSSFLHVMANGDPKNVLETRILRHKRAGVTEQQLIREMGATAGAIEALLKPGIAEGRLLRGGGLIVHAKSISLLQEAMAAAVADFQRGNPLVGGISREQLREKLGAPDGAFVIALTALQQKGLIEADAELVRIAGQGVVMRDEETESKQRIVEAFASAGLRVPALDEVLAGLKVDRLRAHKIVTLLLREQVLVKVSAELVFHREALNNLRTMLAAHKQKSHNLDVASFKEMTGVSRKYAIPLLEYLDRERVTRRVGDNREIL